MPAKPFILCVDDERVLLDSLKGELSTGLTTPCRIEIADSAEEGLEVIQELLEDGQTIPVVISDQLMPGMKGEEFLIKVNELLPKTKKIMLTGQASAESVGRTVNEANLYRFLSKPWNSDDLILTVEQALQSYATDHKLEAGIQTIKDLNRYATFLALEVHLNGWLEALIHHLMADLSLTRVLIHVIDPVRQSYTEGKSEGGTISIEKFLPDNDMTEEMISRQYPFSALKEVIATGKEISFHSGVGAKHPHASEWQRFRAFYCAPLIKSDKLLAVLYLESHQSSEHFNDSRLEFLQALTAQIPISLDNVLLYEGLEDKVADRTRIIEEKNQSITDSIIYAKRIQMAILPSKELLKSHLPKHHIIYEPKDIVCGDFYWWIKVDDYLFVAAADCTGHGVPGAFMSVLGKSLLHQIVKDQNILVPHEILNTLHQNVKQALMGNNENMNVHDGMDIALCRFHLPTQTVEFSGANRPVLHFTDGQLIEYKANKQPIGGNFDFGDGKFSSETFSIRPSDRLFLFSDGISDQFGGKEPYKKWGTKRLHEVLMQNLNRPLEEQMQMLLSELRQHQGNLPQTDDIVMIGIEV